MTGVQPALIGKHPDYGDFIRHGLAPDVAERLMRWMDTTLARVKSSAGDDWEAFWDDAQACRFWLGREVLGQTTLGVMLPTRDKVGRRYPFLALAMGVDVPPPFQDPAEDIFERIELHLNHARGGGAGGAGALLQGLDLSDLPAEGAKPDPVIWAHHPEGDLEKLMRRAAQADHALCATGRSYWWAPARGWRAAAWLGCTGLPGQEALTWILGGEEAAIPEPAPIAPEPEAYAVDAPAEAHFDMDDDPFGGQSEPARPLPEMAAPPQMTAAQEGDWTDDDLPEPSADTLPDIDLPDAFPEPDERAAILADWDGMTPNTETQTAGQPPSSDAPRRDAT